MELALKTLMASASKRVLLTVIAVLLPSLTFVFGALKEVRNQNDRLRQEQARIYAQIIHDNTVSDVAVLKRISEDHSNAIVRVQGALDHNTSAVRELARQVGRLADVERRYR